MNELQELNYYCLNIKVMNKRDFIYSMASIFKSFDEQYILKKIYHCLKFYYSKDSEYYFPDHIRYCLNNLKYFTRNVTFNKYIFK